MLKKSVVAACFAVMLTGLSTAAFAGGDADEGKNKAAACAACHGPDGKAILGAYPNLAGQHADYIVASLKQYKSGKRNNAIMAGFVAALSEQDMKDIAAFYASQKGLGALPQD